MKPWAFRVAVVSLMGVFFSAVGLWQLNEWGHRAQVLDGQRDVYFPKKTRLKELAGILSAQGVVSEPLLFHGWVKLFGDYGKFQAGRYRFDGRISPKKVSEIMTRGEVYQPVILQVTIPEGFTLRKVINRLAAKNVGTVEELSKFAHQSSFLQKYNIPAKSLEGFLYPATYNFFSRPKPAEAFGVMVENFYSKINESLIKKLKDKGLSLLEATTFASLIELETQHEDEKPKIAEVIWRRLKRKEPLGIDAAIIYGIEDYDGDIKWRHLSDKSNPYNTRVRKGLPPGPIGAPSLSSFEAILNPTDKGYYYYVLKADGNKRHHFSKTLNEHNKHVRKLLEASSAN